MSKDKFLEELTASLLEVWEIESNSRQGVSVGVLISWTEKQLPGIRELRDLSDPFWKKLDRILGRNLDFQRDLHEFLSQPTQETISKAEKAKKKLLNELNDL
jgi:hypothetical protein